MPKKKPQPRPIPRASPSFRGGVYSVSTSLFIREHLSAVTEDYAWNIWRELKKVKAGRKCCRYQSFADTIWKLHRLGLIERTGRTEVSDYPGGAKRVYYRIIMKFCHHPGWKNPRGALYPTSYAVYH